MYVHTTAEKVTSGYLYTEINFNNLPPVKETYDLCYILSSVTEIECPLQPSKLKQLKELTAWYLIIKILEDVHYEMSHMLPEVVIPVS